MIKLRRISLFFMIILYACAGVNHFWHPAPYYSIIPPYLPDHRLVNVLAGVAEICGSLLLIFPGSRKFAACGIVAMLIAFIPAHIYMIQNGGCMGPPPALCIPLWLAWVRLFPLQFILIWWAWSVRNVRFKN